MKWDSAAENVTNKVTFVLFNEMQNLSLLLLICFRAHNTSSWLSNFTVNSRIHPSTSAITTWCVVIIDNSFLKAFQFPSADKLPIMSFSSNGFSGRENDPNNKQAREEPPMHTYFISPVKQFCFSRYRGRKKTKVWCPSVRLCPSKRKANDWPFDHRPTSSPSTPPIFAERLWYFLGPVFVHSMTARSLPTADANHWGRKSSRERSAEPQHQQRQQQQRPV